MNEDGLLHLRKRAQAAHDAWTRALVQHDEPGRQRAIATLCAVWQEAQDKGIPLHLLA